MEKSNNKLFLDNRAWGFNEFFENNDFIIISIKMEHQYNFSFEAVTKCYKN